MSWYLVRERRSLEDRTLVWISLDVNLSRTFAGEGHTGKEREEDINEKERVKERERKCVCLREKARATEQEKESVYVCVRYG